MSESFRRKGRPLERVIPAGLLATALFTVLAHGAVEAWSVAAFEAAIILLTVLWGIKALIERKAAVVLPGPLLPVIALLLYGLVQSIAVTGAGNARRSLSFDVEATRDTVLVLFFLVLTSVLAASTFVTRNRIVAVLKFLTITGMAIALFAIIQQLGWDGRFYWLRPSTASASPYGPFVNHNHFAGFILMLIPLGASLALMPGIRQELRALYAFASVLMTVSLLLSLSRGGMISFAAEVLFAGALFSLTVSRYRKGSLPRWRIWAGVLIGVVIVSVTIAGVVWIGSDSVATRVVGNADTFQSSRGWIWHDTIAMIRSNYLYGVGLGAFGTAFPAYSTASGDLIVRQAHNDYLQIAADCGIIGAGFAFWFIAATARAAVRGLRSASTGIQYAGLATGIFGISVHSLFDFNLQLPSNALLFLLLVIMISRAPSEELALQPGSPMEVSR